MTALVQHDGLRIQKAVEEYMAMNDLAYKVEGYEWEFNLVEDTLVNAWAMPGGKVVVYTGILPICKDEDGLAVVMGHEIAHAIAGHGNERMSQGLMVQMGGIAINEALKNKPDETRNLFLTAYGLGATIGVMLPYSRLHESEADHLGLIFMALAGYNPVQAVDFWDRMAKTGGGAPPEFLSTHPSHETRIQDLQERIPEAMQYFKPYSN
jgi:predicted Zn-dependent protease